MGLFFATAALAGDYHYAKLSVSRSTASTGDGVVSVDPRDTQRSADKSSSAQDLKFTITVAPDQDSYLAEWIQSNVKSITLTSANTYTAVVSASSTSRDNPTTASAEAVFHKVVQLAETSPVRIIHTPGTPTTKTINVTVQNGGTTTLTPKITSSNADVFECFTSGSGSSWVLTITLKSEAKEDNTATIKLTTKEGCSASIDVIVKEVQKVQFLPAENGSYTATQTNTTNVYNTFPTTVDINSEVEGAFTFNFTPSTNYRFNRLVIKKNDVVDQILYDDDKNGEISYTFTESCTVQPEFIPTDYAQFIVLGEENRILYDDLNRAVKVIYDNGYSNKVVAVYDKGGRLPKGTYDIPAGYTLLVPGKLNGTTVDYTYLNIGTNPTMSDFATSAAISPKNVCKLVIESGALLNVSGGLCVYGVGNYAQSTDPKNNESMRPGTYGWIEMKDNVVINMNSGSTLHALGYITNEVGTAIDSLTLKDKNTNLNVGKIIVHNNAVVHEVFKMNDWRGGTVVAGGTSGMAALAMNPNAAVGMIKNSARVFPLCQYFIQNIETPTEYNYGAKLKITTIVGISSAYPIATADFFIPNGNEDNIESGLLRLGDQTKVTKYYDAPNDRLKVIVEKTNPTATEQFTTQFHTLVMSLKGKLVMELTVPVKSSDYVLPITSNMDVFFRNGANVEIPATSSIAFLAGSALYIDATSSVDVKADVYIYDRDERVFTTTGKSNVDGKGYFGTHNVTVHPLKVRPGNMLYTRTDADLADAKWLVDGTATINGKLYTTAGGANITSTGGGKIKFNAVGDPTATTSQAFVNGETAEFYAIPITPAKLHNDETLNPSEPYSAGTEASIGETYVYFQKDGKWVVPKIGIATWDSTEFNLTLPNEVTQKVKCPVTADAVTIKSWAFEVTGTGFAQNGTHKYENDSLFIPIKYTRRNIHNKDAAAYEGNLKITIGYDDPTQDDSDLKYIVNIPLTAIEDYTPNFSVEINGTPVADGGTYNMTGFVNKSTIAPVVITPNAENVTILTTTEWDSNVVTPFTFKYGDANKLSDAQLTYFPSDVNSHTGTLELTAIYTDVATPTPNKVAKTITINLTATSDKSPNTLAFGIQKDTIYQGQTIADVFADLGNNGALTFKYNGSTSYESDLITVSKVGENYTIVTKEVDNITDARTITIVASQGENNEMYGTIGDNVTCEIVVLPSAIWNWSDLYFGSTNINPVVPQDDEAWTLELVDNPCSIVALSGNSTDGYQSVIGTPGNPSTTCTATFRFKQGGYTKDFTSTIYADPRVVSYCVDTERTFKGVTLSTNSVTFDDATDKVNFASTVDKTSSWTIQLIGVPSELRFTPTVSAKAWRIEEYNGTAWTTTYALDNIPANQLFTHSLLPSTQQIRITYAAGTESTGALQNVCVSALENVMANTQKIYMPVSKDGAGNVQTTTQKVVLYSVVNADLSISTSTADMTLDVTTLPANTGEYIRQEVVITNSGSNISDVQYLYVKNGAETLLTLPIQPFEFRQGLPINSASDDAERYYFLTTASTTDTWTNQTTNVRWNATNKTIVFQNPGVTGAKRSVAFAYEGAADYISFHTSSNITLSEWKFEESADGVSWAEAVDSVKIAINNGQGIKQPLKYTTRYVRVTYNNPDNLSVVYLNNLIVEGTPHLIVSPEKINLTDDTEQTKMGVFTMTAINLKRIRVESNNPDHFKIIYDANDLTQQVATFTATSTDYPDALGTNKVGDIQLGVAWQAINTIDDGKIIIYNDEDNSILATIQLLGAKGMLTLANANNTGLYTGIPDGTVDPERNYTYHGKKYTDYNYHMIDLTNTFTAGGEALFDYLFIYGETTPESGKNITAPEGKTLVGSNARTPYYVYRKTSDTHGNYVAYQFVGAAEANVATKATIENVIVKDTENNTTYINVEDSLRVYITGFAPYATTGYTKTEEGVFLFRGKHGAKLDVYLENCHIYSRNKTLNGNGFYGNKEGGETFSEGYARGSGGVLVFENAQESQLLDEEKPFEVNIHTIGNNLLKSNYGCFYILLGSMKAYQISAPIHIHMASDKHVRTTKTTLNFDDLWPTEMNASRGFIKSASKRTNGYLGLKKQSNNAPSIDMGNKHTVVNFYGGQVELQNAQIVSENYKTTLAISHRSGFYGGDDVGIQLSIGIGTDSVGGTVNFYDGTTTVEPMWVKEAYKQYYLIDTLADGSEVKKNVGTTEKPIYEYQTSCLRTPQNTYVYGGSHCFMRACQHVTSKGGAPKDGPSGKFLGQYIYSIQPGDVVNSKGLVESIQFPGNLTEPNLNDYYDSKSYTYGLNSISPDANNQLYFWIPDGYGGVKAEQDKFMSTWKACMTEIHAGLGGVVEGGVGGDTPIEPNEEVKYFLYCKIDQNMHNVINAGEGEGDDREYSYKAPVAVPLVAREYFNNAEYTSIAPTFVSDTVEYQVLSDTVYTITDKVFYVTTATPDIWQTFTAPFDVAKIWVVETYPEAELVKVGTRSEILLAQAQHNADFAAFFAVAMAIGTTNDFETIYDSYKKWAWQQDKNSGLYTGRLEDYDLRGKKLLEPYYGGNWRTANYYLNHNTGNWTINDKGEFDTKWKVITQAQYESGTIMHKGETYSMLFPHSMQKNGSLDNRTEWDYWSGKLLIFESTNAPQKINGRDFLNDTIAGNIFTLATPATDEVVVTGNSTFARLDTKKSNAYIYSSGAPTIGQEAFFPNLEYDEDENLVPVSEPTEIWPTTAFLYGYVPTQNGMPAKAITRTGQIIYGDKDNTATDNNQGGKIPTVGGGNDLFITSTAEGINVAVAAPQYVRVLSASGAVLFSGMVNDNVDVAIYTTGVYVVVGENEVRKIMIE